MIQLFHIPNHKIDTSNFSHSLHDKSVEELEKKIAESQARQEEQQKKREAFSNMSLLERMAHEPLSQDQILRNRQRYGVGQ